MTSLRRFAHAVFGVACTHLVFGAIVRISGSGMGCGPHWPKCYGHWFPPLDRPDLVIEVMHRYLASILLLALAALTAAAWRRRAEAGVGGPGGVLRSAALATALGVGAALLGAVTVKLGNTAPATVAHWTVAMSLVAAVAATVVRAGGFGGDAARRGGASGKARRGTFVAAALALVAVVMGGLTAKVPGGSVACLSFPLCGANPAVERAAVHVQSTHRVIAVLLVLHLVGLFFALRKRGEAPVVRRALAIALALGVLQMLVAGAMIGMKLPPVLRSLHEATGVAIWIATFVLAYLARIGSAGSDDARDGATIGGAPSAPAGAPLAGSLADEPFERSTAVAQAVGVAMLATLAFHRTAAEAVASAPAAAREEVAVVEPAAEARQDDDAAVPGAMAAVLAALEAGVSVSPADACVAMGIAPRVDVVTVAVEEAEEAEEAEADDELYNLRGLDADDEDDADDDVAEEDVPSLDEEFSRQAIAAATEALPPVVAPAGAYPSLTSVAARRPAMSHSIAVIVARGADF